MLCGPSVCRTAKGADRLCIDEEMRRLLGFMVRVGRFFHQVVPIQGTLRQLTCRPA